MKNLTAPKKFHVKRNDEVLVLSGASKGQSGKVLQVIRSKSRVIIEGVNIRKKAQRPTQENPAGGFQEKESPIHISNVRVIKSADTALAGKASTK